MGEFVKVDGLLPTTTDEQRMAAIATCARQALSVADLAELLQLLGLDGSAADIVGALTSRLDSELVERAAEVERLQVELAEVYDQVATLLLAVTGRWSSRRPVARQVAGALRDLDRIRAYLESQHDARTG